MRALGVPAKDLQSSSLQRLADQRAAELGVNVTDLALFVEQVEDRIILWVDTSDGKEHE